MPYDLIFYGAMAAIFIGIIAASRRARRQPATGDGDSGAAVAGTDRSGDAADAGGGGGGD